MSKEKRGIEMGNRIELIRKTLNLEQNDFAARLELPEASLSEIESGKHKPGFDFLARLSQVFNVNLHYVLFGEETMFLGPERRCIEKN